jgi:ERCC4-type nuclease
VKDKNKPQMIVVIDSREQRAYKFSDSVVKGLPTGDYSIKSLEDRVTVERKEKSDCYSSLGANRRRFKKELERMAAFDYAAIVIECSLADFLLPPPFSKLNPKAAINTLISWSIRYGVHIFFADNRTHGRGITYRILEKYWKHKGAMHVRQNGTGVSDPLEEL